MRVRNCETYWRMQTFEIGKMAAIDGFIHRGLFLVETVQRKLLDDPEGDLSSDLSYSDDRTSSSLILILKTRGRRRGGGGGGVCERNHGEKARCGGHALTSSKGHMYFRLSVSEIFVIFSSDASLTAF